MSALRAERGMTLVETLIAMVIGVLISLAVFSLVDFTMRRSGEIAGRVDADQRGRLAMDAITRQLRSQVCQVSGTPPMYSRAGNTTDGANATFFVDLSDGSNATQAAEMHTLAFDSTKHQIVERDYTATQPTDPSVDPTYSATPARTRTLLSDVYQVNATPVFQYYNFAGAQLAAPVTGANLGSIAAIQITFDAVPPRGRVGDRGSVVFQDRISVREVDPNAADPEPECA